MPRRRAKHAPPVNRGWNVTLAGLGVSLAPKPAAPVARRTKGQAPPPAFEPMRSGRPATGRRHLQWLLPALVIAVALAYQPAWHGGLLWDDDAHLTRPDLRSVEGLLRIWSEPGATQQYYPLLHTAFWIQHQLWGDAVLGYHLVSIGLHALAAWLIALMLSRLGVPGAPVAACVFALHPVHVESVAWISELKNTLSGVFCLGSALAYLRYDETRRRRDYAVALVCFVLGLMTKTVVAMMPAALLAIFWWQRGRISGRRDLRPLIPFAALGGAAGLLTVWVERALIGAAGAGFDLTPAERILVAGRATWFYLGKLAWPVDLTFIYARWTLDASAWRQYLYPLAAAGLAGALWMMRRRSRAPLAAFAAFIILLFPALGFFNVYPFRYAFVADHFQYLASIPVIALATSVLAAAVGRRMRPGAGALALLLALAAPLAALTWIQSRDYADAERLYRTTIARSPGSWMAYNNLALILLADGRHDEARAHLHEALRRNPQVGEHHLNMGRLLLADGKPGEALEHLQAAVRLDPGLISAQNNLGVAFMRLGRVAEAVVPLSEAVRREPRHAEARANLADALLRLDRDGEARAHVQAALSLSPDLAPARRTAGVLALKAGAYEEARSHLARAVQLAPGEPEAAINLAIALQHLDRLRDALDVLNRAVQLRPDHAPARHLLGVTLFRLERAEDAVVQFERALELDSGLADAHSDLGAALLVLGRTTEAVGCLREAVSRRPADPGARYNLAHALHAEGRLNDAVTQYREAVRLSPADAVIRHDLGVALLGLGRRQEAAEQFAEALRIRPDLEAARAALARIR